MSLNSVRKATAPGIAALLRHITKSPNLPPTLRGRVFDFANKYVSYHGVTATVSTGSGCKIAVSTAPMVEQQIYYFGQWEPRLTRLISAAGSSQSCFVDLGANIGYFTLLAAQHYRQVIAVEASPSVFRRLSGNVALNKADNIRCHNVALGAMHGTAPFYYNPDSSGVSSMSPGPGRVLEAEVPVRRLSDLLSPEDFANVGFIKIDIEGQEHVALRQILEALPLLPDDLQIMVEYGPDREGDLRALLDEFKAEGFRILLLQGPYSVEEYLSASGAGPTEIDSYPDFFCDLLISRN